MNRRAVVVAGVPSPWLKRQAVFVAGVLLQVVGAAPPGVRVNARVAPDTVLVGEPVTLTVWVAAPEGAELMFPAAVDSTGNIEPLDPVSVVPPDASGGEYVATYRLLAWRPGNTLVPLPPVQVIIAGRSTLVSVPSPRVFVRTVLPADSALRVPTAARDIVALPPSRVLLIAGIMSALAVAALIVWLIRRRARGRVATADPLGDAQRAFGRLAALDLIGAGEPARHVTTASEIVREFLATHNPAAARGLTTSELVAAVSEDPHVPVGRVAALLVAADEIKFAPARAGARAAEAIAAEAEAIVSETHRSARRHAEAKP